MKRKRAAKETGENTNNNELEAQINIGAKVTASTEGVHEKPYLDHINHSQEEQQQVGLLASELSEEKDNPKSISTRLLTLVPNVLVKSHHQRSFHMNSVLDETEKSTIKAKKKMLRDGDNSSSRRSGTDIDVESNEKTNKGSKLKVICTVVLLMALAVILTFVVLFLKPKVLDNEDPCRAHEGPFHNYKLFSTKTLYDTAFNYISKYPASSLPHSTIASNQSNHLSHSEYDKSLIYVPKIFSSQDSLESIHKRLISEKCVPKQFHFFGRHAARTPDDADISNLIKHITRIKSRVSQVKTSSLMINDEPSASTPGAVETNAVNSSAKESCNDPLTQLLTWEEFVVPGQGNLVTEAGFIESEGIAKRLKNIYPEFFDGNQSKINIGTTGELRTAQTAVSFISQMSNSPTKCLAYPDVNTQDKTKSDSILRDQCLSDLMSKNYMEILEFHKKCKKLRHIEQTRDFGLTNPLTTKHIAKSISAKLQLTGDNELSTEEAKAIYDVCRYESAQLGQTSLWCRFLSESDVKFYEYITDALDYHNEVYGHESFIQSTCEITKDLLQQFRRGKTPEAGVEASFYFTHSSVIQKMVGASYQKFKQETIYSEPNIKKILKERQAPREREWQSSLISPFSTNIAFTLYNCTKSPSAMTGSAENFKVVTSLNEQPILLDGCSDVVCGLDKLMTRSKMFRDAEECDFSNICTMKHVVT